MKKIRSYLILVLLLLGAGPAWSQAPQDFTKAGASFEPGFLYVQFKASSRIDVSKLRPANTGIADLDRIFSRIGVTSVEPFCPPSSLDIISRGNGIGRIANVRFSSTELSMSEIASMLMQLPEVDLVSRNILFRPCAIPNDPSFSLQWSLAEMHVPQAWDITTGDTNVVMAVLDVGVNYNHEDLKDNLSLNSGEMGLDGAGHDKRTNGIDDDGDGYVDNWHGWDFGGHDESQPDNDPVGGPGEGHGTFVTGCLGATVNNGIGIAGVGNRCRYLPLKCTPDSGKDAQFIVFGYPGITYATNHHARIINCSWGEAASLLTPAELKYAQMIVDNAHDHGSLVVVAAGNDGNDIDVAPFIPANLAGVLTVGGTQKGDSAMTSWNHGHRVDVYAPGANVYSTEFPGDNSYGYSGGTSFSTPNTVGIAALIASKHPDWDPHSIATQIINTCDVLAYPSDRNKYWGKVNAFTALSQLPTFPGLVITDYTVDGVDSAALMYLNKKYTLGVTFKNVVGNATTLTARLVAIDGYTVQQSTVSLAAMTSETSKSGTFQFTRDSTDDGSELPMKIYVTDGKTYHDTLGLTLAIGADNIYIDNGVAPSAVTSPSLAISPNPASAASVAYFTLAGEGRVALSIIDLLGRTVRSFDAGIFAAGSNKFELPLNALAPGMYFVKLETQAGAPLTSRMIVR